ncbi:MAG TPA: dihydrolipoamide acetyltransferase family protein [Trebonia sp.]|jgi:pyruvate dehydrogenase E2 component (dihydrolipoamide acetyltransferase)
MAEFLMPSLGADMDQGTLLEWLVKPGDQVHKGDIVAVVDTDKAAVEVECFESGVFGAILVEPGTTVPVGTPLARITSGKAAAAPAAVPAPAAPAAAAPAAPPTPPPGRPIVPATPPIRHLARQLGVDIGQLHGTGPGGTVTHADVEAAAARQRRPRVSPLARRLAADLGIDLTAVRGTGPGGAIRADDVRRAVPEAKAPSAAAPPERAERPAVPPAAAAERPPAQPEPQVEAERQAAMRRAIGNLMARSKREIPHYYLSTTIDLETMTQWLRSRNRELPVPARIVPAALLLKAAALAAREVPQLNGFWLDDHFVPAGHVHLGVAISLRDAGMVAPAIHDADTLTLADLMARLRDLVTRARTGRLRGSEMTDPTITVTNLGDRGVEAVFGVIYPPQVALAGFGKVISAPCAVDGLLGVRSQVSATLAADHRASDGYTGARYLEAITRLLQKPEKL